MMLTLKCNVLTISLSKAQSLDTTISADVSWKPDESPEELTFNPSIVPPYKVKLTNLLALLFH